MCRSTFFYFILFYLFIVKKIATVWCVCSSNRNCVLRLLTDVEGVTQLFWRCPRHLSWLHLQCRTAWIVVAVVVAELFSEWACSQSILGAMFNIVRTLSCWNFLDFSQSLNFSHVLHWMQLAHCFGVFCSQSGKPVVDNGSEVALKDRRSAPHERNYFWSWNTFVCG